MFDLVISSQPNKLHAPLIQKKGLALEIVIANEKVFRLGRVT